MYTMCTHIIYAFFGVTPDANIKYMNPTLDVKLKNIESVIALKAKNPNLKIIASIQQTSTNFSMLADDPILREKFAVNVLKFIEMWGFDGVDIHWVFSGQRSSNQSRDKNNFSLMLRRLSDK